MHQGAFVRRARNAKSRRPNAIAGGSLPAQIFAEMLQHLLETPIVRGRIALPRNQLKVSAMFFECSQVAFCAADIARNDHWSTGKCSGRSGKMAQGTESWPEPRSAPATIIASIDIRSFVSLPR